LVLNEDNIEIARSALFNVLLDPIILERMLVYQASSKTDLTDDPAFSPVP
jgi:hypothetical protein